MFNDSCMTRLKNQNLKHNSYPQLRGLWYTYTYMYIYSMLVDSSLGSRADLLQAGGNAGYAIHPQMEGASEAARSARLLWQAISSRSCSSVGCRCEASEIHLCWRKEVLQREVSSVHALVEVQPERLSQAT